MEMEKQIEWLHIYDTGICDIMGKQIKPNIFKLMLVLDKIKRNNYYFIESEKRANFEVYLEMFKDNLPPEYKLIVKEFEMNPNRWGAPPQDITFQLPENVLKWLQETICSNGKPFIEDASANRLKWLQNKQRARELLTYEKIKGDLSTAEIERIAPTLFIDKYNNPLKFANNKPTKDKRDSNILNNFLATL